MTTSNDASNLEEFGRRPIGFQNMDESILDNRGEQFSDHKSFKKTNLNIEPTVKEAAKRGPEAPLDGRYTGGNHELYVELRIDSEICGLISADLYRRDISGDKTYVASLKTDRCKQLLFPEEKLSISAEDRNGRRTTGYLKIQSIENESRLLHCSFSLIESIDGLPHHRETPFSAEWQGKALRQLGLEIEYEELVDRPPEINFLGAPMSVRIALENAGIETYTVGSSNTIPKASTDGWSEKSIEALMYEFAQTPLDRPTFELRLLWLSKSNRPGLLGVMFDVDDNLPRQGLATFAQEIAGRYPPGQREIKLIQTTVHEIGHALNLAHRFERIVGRLDSLSFMNYDWRYRGGNHERDYWTGFRCTFDDDELAFLRHGPLPAIIPGGKEFHSAEYWREGNGGYPPYVNESSANGLNLSLDLPINGPVFKFGQPVILGIRLKNTTAQPIRIPSFLLDLKAGFLEILIRRVGFSRQDQSETQHFSPIVARCFDAIDEQNEVLDPTAEKLDNVNITFGRNGFSFSEPGQYQISAILAFFDTRKRMDHIIASSPVTIRVGHPHDASEEKDGMLLFQNNVGRYFALGGSGRSRKISESLSEMAARRTYVSKSKKSTQAIAPSLDPVVTNILRCQAFEAARDYLRFEAGGMVMHKGNATSAFQIAKSLDSQTLKTFDFQTAISTEAFFSQLARASGENDSGIE